MPSCTSGTWCRSSRRRRSSLGSRTRAPCRATPVHRESAERIGTQWGRPAWISLKYARSRRRI
jgi:hypothetical protein